MKITFSESVRNNSGTIYHCKIGDSSFLINAGINYTRPGSDNFYIEKLLENESMPDFIIITSGRTDHCGLLPLLVQKGFSGQIFGTKSTIHRAFASLQEMTILAEEYDGWLAKKAIRLGLQQINPLFNETDVLKVQKQLIFTEAGKEFSPLPEITCVINENKGTNIDSISLKNTSKTLNDDDISSIMITPSSIVLDSQNKEHFCKKSTWAGKNSLLICDDSKEMNYDKVSDEFIDSIKNQIKDTTNKQGKIIIPVLCADDMYFLLPLLEKVLIDLPVFIDSPIADNITSDLEKLLKPDFFKLIKTVSSIENSRNIPDKPCVIIASHPNQAGGRLAHHLKHHLYDASNSILLIDTPTDHNFFDHLAMEPDKIQLFGNKVCFKAPVFTFNTRPPITSSSIQSCQEPSKPGNSCFSIDLTSKNLDNFSKIILTQNLENTLFDIEKIMSSRCKKYSSKKVYVPLATETIALSPKELVSLRTAYEPPMPFHSTVENDLALDISNFQRAVEETGYKLNNLTGELSNWALNREDAIEAVTGCSKIIELIIESLSCLGTEGIAEAENTIGELSNKLSSENQQNQSEALATLSQMRLTLDED